MRYSLVFLLALAVGSAAHGVAAERPRIDVAAKPGKDRGAPPAGAMAAKPAVDMALDRWAKLREVERFQLQTAEKYLRDQNWTQAAAEYEKYLQLYEKSEAAPYAQLQWSLCQVRLRKANTAIKDGFQAVLDYWPESPDAVLAGYYMGDTYKGMGQTARAKRALLDLVEKHPKHPVAVYAMVDLAEIAAGENDAETQAAMWKKLAFEVQRTKENRNVCAQAAINLAGHLFAQAALDEGIKALETTYKDDELPPKVAEYLCKPLAALAARADSRAKADKLLDLAVAWFRGRVPADTAAAEQKSAARDLWFMIADVRAAAGADAKVAETFEQIVKLFGQDDAVLGRMAAWYESRGRHDEAYLTYRRFADRVAGLTHIAQSYRRRKECDGAVAAYKELMGLDAQRPLYWQGQIADTYYETRKWKQAIAAYGELVQQDAAHADAWRWKLAMSYMDARQYPEAITQFRQCDKFPANYREMATCHRRMKQYNEALLLYNQIAGADPKSAPWAMLEIAQTHEEAGSQDKAIKAYRDVCRLFPRDPHASKAHAHLQSKYKISVTLGGDVQP